MLSHLQTVVIFGYLVKTLMKNKDGENKGKV